MTISRSSLEDLVKVGIERSEIRIIPMASDIPVVDELAPSAPPLRLVVIGRLTPAKFIEEGIAAFARIQAAVPEAVLDIVGSGDERYRGRLEQQVLALGLCGVTFHGRVSQEEKLRLLGEAHVHVFTSHREGWGLTVTEAAARGTPSVGYDVPGVRDSIDDRRLLAPSGDPGALADRVIALHRDPQLLEAVRREAWNRVSGWSWDATARSFREAIA